MERTTMSLDHDLAAGFDEPIASRGYNNRSEAMGGLLRREIDARCIKYPPRGQCVAGLSYIYNHHVRDLAARLTTAQHAHHDLVVATAHFHPDHEQCLDDVFLKGSTATVRAFADRILAERGVTRGQLNVITVIGGDTHVLPSAHRHHGHLHLTPRA